MENPWLGGHVLQKTVDSWISIFVWHFDQDAQLRHLPSHSGSSNLLQTDPCPVPQSQCSAQGHVVQALSFQRVATVDRPKIGAPRLWKGCWSVLHPTKAGVGLTWSKTQQHIWETRVAHTWDTICIPLLIKYSSSYGTEPVCSWFTYDTWLFCLLFVVFHSNVRLNTRLPK